MTEFAFDVLLRASLRVTAETEKEARRILAEHLDAADCNGGRWPDGDPILFEASLADDIAAPVLFEIDGEATGNVGIFHATLTPPAEIAGDNPSVVVTDSTLEALPDGAVVTEESACRAAGWMQGGGHIFHGPTWGEDWKAAVSWSGTHNEPSGENDKPAIYDDWAECYAEEIA